MKYEAVHERRVWCADCTCLTVKSDRHVDYSGQFYRHSTLTFNDLPYYIRAGDGKMTSSPRDCDLFLYAFTEVYTSFIDACAVATIFLLLGAMLCIARTTLSQDVCLSVRPSVCHMPVLCQNG